VPRKGRGAHLPLELQVRHEQPKAQNTAAAPLIPLVPPQDTMTPPSSPQTCNQRPQVKHDHSPVRRGTGRRRRRGELPAGHTLASPSRMPKLCRELLHAGSGLVRRLGDDCRLGVDVLQLQYSHRSSTTRLPFLDLDPRAKGEEGISTLPPESPWSQLDLPLVDGKVEGETVGR